MRVFKSRCCAPAWKGENPIEKESLPAHFRATERMRILYSILLSMVCLMSESELDTIMPLNFFMIVKCFCVSVHGTNRAKVYYNMRIVICNPKSGDTLPSNLKIFYFFQICVRREGNSSERHRSQAN